MIRNHAQYGERGLSEAHKLSPIPDDAQRFDFVNPFSEMTYLVTLTKSKLLTDVTILADMTVPISGDVAFDSRTPLCSLEYA